MVKIDLNVALSLKEEIEQAMNGEKGQHMIKKGDSRPHVRTSGTVQTQFDFHVRFQGFALEFSCAFHHPSGPCRPSWRPLFSIKIRKKYEAAAAFIRFGGIANRALIAKISNRLILFMLIKQ
ncbi:uncharacterized protein Dmul_24070 [Desulfococcus multivorans]|nr:uncharacterized protein Dmul_24070 [Desulfococcus multivorans]